MRVDRHLFRLLGVALALTVAACGKDSSQPTAALSKGEEVSSADLDATLNAERARVANRRFFSASNPARDAYKNESRNLKHSNAHEHSGN